MVHQWYNFRFFGGSCLVPQWRGIDAWYKIIGMHQIGAAMQ